MTSRKHHDSLSGSVLLLVVGGVAWQLAGMVVML